ncbi:MULTISPECIES: hypothetical protein [Rhodomicrobium]|uniref:hypothetical protein n=1 Tax=Rhodomicrobium TaxID=1068 RepID=UPI000B4C1A40|nr:MULTISPECIES: hypothetical protein [Rhodomicrobium]
MSKALKLIRATVPAMFVLAIWAGGALAAASTPNDTARFLAGLAPAPGTPLAAKAEDANWKRHAAYFDGAWDRLDKRQLSRIRSWQAKNMTSPQPTLFYMFSGPDFLYANAFFPKASTYVMSGLEPAGKVPELSEMNSQALARETRNLEVSLNSLLSVSFFITSNMQRQLRAGKVFGTLPVIYVFLARSGKTIDDMTYVDIDAEGNVVPVGQAADPKTATHGIKIGFTGADGAKQTLYYFTTDISNTGVKKYGFIKFCEKLGTGDAFVKSASYLLHSGGFSGVREFLLAKSATILQDDTGVPVQYFKADDWDLKPHGRYLGPISIFRGNYQNRLAKIFKGDKRESIEFGVGYRWRPNESNLLMAVKRQKTTAVAR